MTLPPDFIDPEHQGRDRELLHTFYEACDGCDGDGGTVDESILQGIRAVLALAAADKPAAAAPQQGLPWPADLPAVPESREPAAGPAASAIGGVGEDKSGCARIELVTAIYCLASHFEIACSDLCGDDLQKARNDIAHARCIAAKHNQNGPGCPQFPPACWGRPIAPEATGQPRPLSPAAQAIMAAIQGETSPQIIVAQAYRALAFLRLAEPNACELLVDVAQELDP